MIYLLGSNSPMYDVSQREEKSQAKREIQKGAFRFTEVSHFFPRHLSSNVRRLAWTDDSTLEGNRYSVLRLKTSSRRKHHSSLLHFSIVLRIPEIRQSLHRLLRVITLPLESVSTQRTTQDEDHLIWRTTQANSRNQSQISEKISSLESKSCLQAQVNRNCSLSQKSQFILKNVIYFWSRSYNERVERRCQMLHLKEWAKLRWRPPLKRESEHWLYHLNVDYNLLIKYSLIYTSLLFES